MIAPVSAVMPAVASAAPRASIGLRPGAREGGTSARPPASAIAMIGRLMRKIDPQAKCSNSQPPRVGPIATPSPLTAVQIAIACARSTGSANRWMRIESVDGMIAAAPIPITTRPAMSAVGVAESAARTDPSANTTSPIAST